MNIVEDDYLNSIEFWEKRRDEQIVYMKSILHRVKATQKNALDRVEVHRSAIEVMKNIEKQIIRLKTDHESNRTGQE